MRLAADFADLKACPHCGSPARRYGRWFVQDGQWAWEKRDILIAGPRKERPMHGQPARWTNIPEWVTSSSGKESQVERWWIVGTHICEGYLLGNVSHECGVFPAIDLDDYKGEILDRMKWPEPPKHKTLDAHPVTAAVVGDAEW